MGQLQTRYIVATAAWCGLIFYVSSITDPPDPGVSLPYLDKAVHMLLYAGLTATLSYGIRKSNETPGPWVQWVVPVVFAVVYGFTDELHQLYVPNRGWENADIVADGAGAVLAQLAHAVWFWRRPAQQ